MPQPGHDTPVVYLIGHPIPTSEKNAYNNAIAAIAAIAFRICLKRGCSLRSITVNLVVSATDFIRILNQNVHRNQRPDTAKERTEDEPQKNRGSVLCELHSVTVCIALKAVAELVIPIIGVDAAGDVTQNNESNQTGRAVAVTLAGRIDILRHAVNEPPAVDAAGNQR